MIRPRFLVRETPRLTAETLLLRHGDDEVVVAVRRSARARRYTLRLRAAERDAVLTLPKRGSMSEAKSFAERHAAWLMARLARLPERIDFADGASIPVRGVVHRIAHRPGARGVVWAEAGADGTALLVVAGEAAHVARRVRDWLVRQARADLTAASARHAAAAGRPILRITVRDTRTRWGSCSHDGRISYSWRIVMAPPHVLDYLAAHEVAHLVELNHSRRFWALVERLCPSHRAARAWLKAHGGNLHLYG